MFPNKSRQLFIDLSRYIQFPVLPNRRSCATIAPMVSWNIVIGLLIIAMVLPFFYLHSQLEQLRRKNRSCSAELGHIQALQKQEAEQQEKEKSLFLEALGVPFLLIRPSGRLVLANSYAGILLGIDPECRMNLLRMLPDSPAKKVIENACKAEESTHHWDFAMMFGQEERFFRAAATPLGNADRHIGIVFHDVTEEHRAQVIRKEFVANASQELQTPLSIIDGYLDSLLDDPAAAADPEQRTRALELMKQQNDRVMGLVEDMLAVSRLESTERDYLRREDFDLADVVSDVRLRLNTAIERQQATLRVAMDPQPFLMRGDKFYWTQILFNLLENSLKNNPQSGLQMELHAVRESGGKCSIEVKDNGIGIAANALPYIFNRFYRADSTGKVKGTGLGLSIVKHSVEAHGGSISATSMPGKETVFRITLPPSAFEI